MNNLRQEIEHNIDSILKNVNPKDMSLGIQWYAEAHSFCKDLSIKYNVPFRKVVGVCVVLSPLKSWNLNKRITEDFLQCNDCGHFESATKKALLILNLKVEPDQDLLWDHFIMQIIGGKKTKAFYHNIVYPNNYSYVCLDSHMWKLKPKKWQHITPNRYQIMSNVIIQKADELDICPNHLQAILWLKIRKKNIS